MVDQKSLLTKVAMELASAVHLLVVVVVAIIDFFLQIHIIVAATAFYFIPIT
jgi:hypothetical protein